MSSNAKKFLDPRHPVVMDGPSPSLKGGDRRDAALQCCIDIYNDYSRTDMSYWATNIQIAWKIGKMEVEK